MNNDRQRLHAIDRGRIHHRHERRLAARRA